MCHSHYIALVGRHTSFKIKWRSPFLRSRLSGVPASTFISPGHKIKHTLRIATSKLQLIVTLKCPNNGLVSEKKYIEKFSIVGGGGQTQVWKIPYFFFSFFLKASLTVKSILFVNFSLLDSYTVIPGSPVRHVDVGSVLNITCLVVNFPLKLDYIIFYHNDKVKHTHREESSLVPS